jgi:hypothetical protein
VSVPATLTVSGWLYQPLVSAGRLPSRSPWACGVVFQGQAGGGERCRRCRCRSRRRRCSRCLARCSRPARSSRRVRRWRRCPRS